MQQSDTDTTIDKLKAKRNAVREDMLEAKRTANTMEKRFFLSSGGAGLFTALTIALVSTISLANPLTIGGVVLSGIIAAGFGYTSFKLNNSLADWRDNAESLQLDFQYHREKLRDYTLSKMQAHDIAEALQNGYQPSPQGAEWQDKVKSEEKFTSLSFLH